MGYESIIVIMPQQNVALFYVSCAWIKYREPNLRVGHSKARFTAIILDLHLELTIVKKLIIETVLTRILTIYCFFFFFFFFFRVYRVDERIEV
jgi:hypothetical protein